MKLKSWLASLALATALPSLAGAQATLFRGYAEIERVLGQRITLSGTPLSLAPYVAYESGLLEQLGSWQVQGSERVFANGLPNSVNMLIWYAVLHVIANDLAATCEGGGRVALNPEFLKALKEVCAWPAESAKSEAAMQAFWIGLMGYTAPEEEYQAWRAFFLKSSHKDKQGRPVVAAMALTIMMNPFFLLQN